jgi:hypothetical protein
MLNRTLVTLIISLSFASFSQNDWTLYKSVSGVNIFSKSVDCYPKNGMAQTAVLFRFENTTTNGISIDWNVRIWYNGEESIENVSNNERHYELKLSSKQIIESDTQISNNKLFLYKKFLNFEKSATLTRFELENIKVSINK